MLDVDDGEAARDRGGAQSGKRGLLLGREAGAQPEVVAVAALAAAATARGECGGPPLPLRSAS